MTSNDTHTVSRTLVLASTSPYRRALLERLGLAFESLAPQVDESRLDGEGPVELVQRLAEAKARAGAAHYPDALIIGSDQVAVCDQAILGKPGDHARAVEQLTRLSGRRVSFYTGLCLYDAGADRARVEMVPFDVVFRRLDAGRIERYLQRERPYNCAGSFKSEGLGISLFEALQGDDPNALIGLPLIRLVGWLNDAGVEVP
jgi:MAF protein